MKNQSRDDEAKLVEVPELPETPVMLRMSQNREFTAFMVDPLYEWDQVLRLINLLEVAEESDTIYITIAGPGGRVEIGQALVEAIRRSKAVVVGRLRGLSCASMHSVILLACDYIDLSSGTRMMLHTYSGGAYGTGGGNILRDAESLEIACKELQDSLVEGFLTEEELAKINSSNHDLYFTGTDLVKRVRNMYCLRSNKGRIKEGLDYLAYIADLNKVIHEREETSNEVEKPIN